MVARQMNPAASILLAKSGLPLGALGSLAAQRSIDGQSFARKRQMVFHPRRAVPCDCRPPGTLRIAPKQLASPLLIVALRHIVQHHQQMAFVLHRALPARTDSQAKSQEGRQFPLDRDQRTTCQEQTIAE